MYFCGQTYPEYGSSLGVGAFCWIYHFLDPLKMAKTWKDMAKKMAKTWKKWTDMAKKQW